VFPSSRSVAAAVSVGERCKPPAALFVQTDRLLGPAKAKYIGPVSCRSSGTESLQVEMATTAETGGGGSNDGAGVTAAKLSTTERVVGCF
jgi:hypothetical protein